MESNTICFIIVGSTNFKRWSLIWRIVPDSHTLVNRAGGNQILLNADIHTLNSTRMEWIDEILIARVIRWSFKVDVHLHDLVVLCSESNAVIS